MAVDGKLAHAAMAPFLIDWRLSQATNFSQIQAASSKMVAYDVMKAKAT